MEEVVRKVGQVRDVTGTHVRDTTEWDNPEVTHFRLCIANQGFDFSSRAVADKAAEAIRVAYKLGRREAFAELRKLIGAAP